MNLLFLTPYFPYPLNSGGNQAQFHMIDQLRKRARITIVHHAIDPNQESQLKSLWPDVRFRPYARDFRTKFREKTESFVRHNLFGASRTRLHVPNGSLMTPEFLAHIQDVVQETKPDLLQVDFYPYIYLGFAFPKVRKIFVQHEIEFVKYERELGAPDTLSDWDAYQVVRRRGEEIAAMNAYDAVVTLTDVDKNILEANHVVVPVHASPAAVAASNAPFDPDRFEFNGKVVFLGGYHHKPNPEGLKWFLEKVWPSVERASPDLRVQVVGNWPESARQQFSASHPGIEFLGFVPNLAEVLRESIMVVPILVGSGMRMKILEAAQYGSPFVTTTVGVEGLPFQDSLHCEVADTPEEFGARLTALATDPVRRLALRREAKNLHERELSAEAMVERRWNVYSQVLSGG